MQLIADLFDVLHLYFLDIIIVIRSSVCFPFEKVFLGKERKADMYILSVYYVCSTLCDMIAHILYPTLFMTILYFMAGFKRTAECYFMTLAAVLLVATTSQVSNIIIPTPNC